MLGTVLFSWGAVAAPPTVAAELVSHVAEYRLRLSSTTNGSAIVAARGAFDYRFERVCDGWVSEMRNALILQGTEGSAINSAYSMTQWEDFDATRYRFRMRDFQDGQLIDEVNGEAQRLTDKVVVHYESPVEIDEDLPLETLFPMQHSIKLLDQARRDERFGNDLVFDGAGDTPNYRIAAVISGVRSASNKADDADNIAKDPFYRMSLAFYRVGEAESGPTYEMAIDYGGNGVAQRLVQNYGDFILEGELVRVRKLPLPECN
ncbi:MAG: DUF1849 family protein [Pseudomonadota bacterium]